MKLLAEGGKVLNSADVLPGPEGEENRARAAAPRCGETDMGDPDGMVGACTSRTAGDTDIGEPGGELWLVVT